VLREGRTEVARVDDKITEYGGRRTKDGKIAVQRCKSEGSSCVKVERLIQVGIALRAILGESRQLGWHAVPTLPEATRAARGAAPTRGRGKPTRGRVKRGAGERDVGKRLESSLNYLSAKR
jgi:hypothetical protein